MEIIQNANAMKLLRVVHPLDDMPEEKLRTDKLGPIELTSGVKVLLMVLRVYLILVTLMLVYHVAGLAGIVGTH